MIIKDPVTGDAARVNSEGKITVVSVSTTFSHHVNHDNGETYSIVLDQTPTGADDCILWLVNNDEKDLIIDAISAFAAGAVELYIQLGDDGIPNTPTDLVPVNRNAGSGYAADVTCQQGADLAAAAVLAGGLEVDRIALTAAAESLKYWWRSSLILPKNSTLTLWASAAQAVNVTLSIYFHNDS